MEVDLGLASVITAICTGLVMYAGQAMARRGKKEDQRQTAAAEAFAQTVKRAEMAEAAEQRERERADRERDRADRAEDECDRARDEMRGAVERVHAEYQKRFRDMSEVLVLMHKTVRSEIVRTAAEMVMDEAVTPPTPGPDSLDRWLDQEPDN